MVLKKDKWWIWGSSDKKFKCGTQKWKSQTQKESDYHPFFQNCLKWCCIFFILHKITSVGSSWSTWSKKCHGTAAQRGLAWSDATFYETPLSSMLSRNPTIFNIICWVTGSIVSSTKHLMVQVLFWYIENKTAGLNLEHSKLVILIFVYRNIIEKIKK